MTGLRVGAAALAFLVVTAFTACANTVSGTATWPGAKLEKVALTAADFPPGVQFDRLVETPGQPDGAGGPPAMRTLFRSAEAYLQMWELARGRR